MFGRLTRRRARLTSASGETQGQAMILVALSIVVLLLAVALGTEWGFGLTQRRLAQNGADAGALAAARLLAGSVRATSSGNMYAVTEKSAFCTALDYARNNVQSFRPSGPSDGLIVEWAAADGTGAPALPWLPLTSPDPLHPELRYGCPAVPGTPVLSGPFVNASAVFIRATPTVTYSSPLARLAGQPSLTASARAVARIVGVPLSLDAQTWPMVRHFNAADFAGAPCVSPCNPMALTPVTFWSSGNSPDITFNNFTGLVDFSRFSPNANAYNGKPPCDFPPNANAGTKPCVPQLIKGWDRSGLGPNGKPDLVHVFSGGTPCSPPAPVGQWLTAGLEDTNNADKACSLMNWIGYGFGGPTVAAETGPRGEVSLTNLVWHGNPMPNSRQEEPSALPNSAGRIVCASVPPQLPNDSCASPQMGDWVEAGDTGNVGNNVASALRYFIDQHGVSDAFEHVLTGNGAGAPEYGKKVVILVYLWDCAESFDGAPSGNNQWSLILPSGGGSDCSNIHSGNDIGSVKIGRVHLFSAAPFTFYRGLVQSSLIRGFWGGAVSGDPGACASNPTAPGCAINPFSNAVFLVADD
jgi:Flp pilus assembly protein TadG